MNEHPLTLPWALLILVQCLAWCASGLSAGLGALSFGFFKFITPMYEKQPSDLKDKLMS